MIDDVYNAKILELAGSVPKAGRLADVDGTATRHSKLCGSTVRVDVKMDGDVVSDIAMEVRACALGQATASVFAANAIGASRQEIESATDALRDMLRGGDLRPAGRFSDLAFLEPVRDYRARHASTLLAGEALVGAMVDAQGAAAAA